MRKGQAMEPVRTTIYRVVKSEAGGRFTRHYQPRSSCTRGGDIWGSRYTIQAAACLVWGVLDTNTRNVRLRHCAGAQVSQTSAVGQHDLPLPEADVRPPPSGKRCALQRRQGLTSWTIVIERGGLRDASASYFRHKSILIDVTYADPQAGVHLRAGSSDQDGSATSFEVGAKA